MSARALVLVAVLAGTIAHPVPVEASSSTETFVTMIDDPHGRIVDGEKLFYHPGNGEVRVDGGVAGVTVSASGGTLGREYTLDFEAPRGETLRLGTYDRAVNHAQEGRPGIRIVGENRGCNGAGRFTVKHLGWDGGSIASIWIIFEYSCGGWGGPAVLGEVRYRVPGDGGAALIGSREVRWPDSDPLQQGMQVVAVGVVNPTPGSITVGESRIEGPAAAEFEVRLDQCAGQILDPNESCLVWIRYLPAATRGLRTATLMVPESSGATHLVRLEGTVLEGTTRFVVSSAPGEPIGDGGYYDYRPQNARVHASGTLHRAAAAVIGTDGNSFSVILYPPPGEQLEAGVTYQVGDTVDQQEGVAAIHVQGESTVCSFNGEFTVSEIGVNAFGEVTRLGVSFEHQCEGSRWLRGTADFRVHQPHDPPQPFQTYRRRVSLNLQGRSLSGRVSTRTGPTECVARVPVLIQRRRGDGTFRVLARVQTNTSGVFDRRLERIQGSYRARAIGQPLDRASNCRAATSPTRSAPRDG